MEKCAACGAENREGARFCDSCGATLAAPAEAREQRKTVTVLFCDVTGSTALGERLDAESFRRVLARYFEEARGAIERHGGTVEKFIGDAVMAVFGVPVLHEDDAVRAVRAADELRSGLQGLNAELGRDYGTTLEVRIGISTGEVVTGTEERLATGDPVNLAARLQQAAEPGEILLGAETLALARDAVTVDELEPLELKGKSGRVPAYRLQAVEAGAPGLARHLDAPMVGRAHERRLLEAAFEGVVRQRTCALFTLLGTAGIGKSRLTREFLANVDARVVSGRCLSYGEGVTFWPVVEVVKQLDDGAARLRGESPAAASAIGALLGEGTASTPEEIAWAVRKLLEATAAERPLVVVLDDIHWGEPVFLDLVENLADLSRDAPILLLCLARPELLDRRAGWGGGKLNATTVLLESLDAGETDELIERLLGPEELDPAFGARIRVAAEGNPLFVEEMLAMVRESGGREVTVPPTIRALLAARLDQLDPVERTVLERGSVEGQLFHRGAVEALAVVPVPVERQLVSLVRKELLRPDRSQIRAEDAYRFRHLLIRDAAYDALPKATRAELHERFADWLGRHGAYLVERDEIVGYHLEQAYGYRAELGPVDAGARALAERAAGLLAAGGRRARFRGDKPAAAALFARAGALSPEIRRAVVAEIAAVLLEVGELGQAVIILDATLEDARAAGDAPAEAIATLVRASLGGHLAEPLLMGDVVELAVAAEGLLEGRGDDARLAAVLEIDGRHRFFGGRAREGVVVLERGFELASSSGDLPCALDCLHWIWTVKTFGPASVSEARATFDSFPVELSDNMSNRLWLEMSAGLVDGFAGDFALARERLAEAKALADELGLRVTRGGIAMYAGLVELLAGDPAAAERELRDGDERLAALGESGFRSTVTSLLADALVRLGRLDEADDALDTAEGLAQADDIDPQVRLRAVRAQILLRRGRLDEAERFAREGVAVAAATDYSVQHGDALVALAEVLEAKGHLGEAAAALREALALYEQKEDVPQIEQTRRLLEAVAV